jgi:hypothetical protein
MSGLLGLISKAGQAKQNLLKSFRDPNNQGGGLFDKADDFKANLVQRKGDMLSQPMRDMGFGNAMIAEMPRIEMFDDGLATDSAKLLQSTLTSGGIGNPSASLLQLGKMDLSLPNTNSPFREAEDDGYKTPLQREQELMELEQASQRSGVLSDPNNFLPTPEAGVLSMRMA